MSCSCQFHFEMPQMCVAPSLGGMGPGNESLTMLPPPKKKKAKSQQNVKVRVSIVREVNAKLSRRDPSLLCVSPFKTSHFPLWVFMTLLQEPMGVCQRGFRWESLECLFSGFCFPVHSMLVLSCLAFRNHKQEYWPLKWTKEGKSGLAGAQHWVMEKVVWTLGRDESDIEERYSLPVTLRSSSLTIIDAVISLFGSKMFFMIQMKNVAWGCYSF